MDKRFEAAQQQMDQRFLDLNKRLDRFMVWSLGLTLSASGLVIAALKLWP
jgi:hypothetical protein